MGCDPGLGGHAHGRRCRADRRRGEARASRAAPGAGLRDRAQLPRPRRGGGAADPRRADGLHEVPELSRRSARGRPAHRRPRRLGGRAGRRDRPRGGAHPRGAGLGPRGGHDRRAGRLGSPAAVRLEAAAVQPRQVGHRVRTDRTRARQPRRVPRSRRDRPALLGGGRADAGLEHAQPDLRRAGPYRAHLALLPAAARRPDLPRGHPAVSAACASRAAISPRARRSRARSTGSAGSRTAASRAAERVGAGGTRDAADLRGRTCRAAPRSSTRCWRGRSTPSATTSRSGSWATS